VFCWGAVELGRPDRPPGSIIYRGGDKQTLRVLERLEDEPGVDDPELFAILVVEEVEPDGLAGGVHAAMNERPRAEIEAPLSRPTLMSRGTA